MSDDKSQTKQADEPAGAESRPDAAAGDPAELGDGGKRALETERKARRDAEQRLAGLTQKVEALQRAEVERIAGGAADGFRPLADASDLWKADGVQLDAMLGEDGAVDAVKVREAVGGVLDARPHWGVAPPRLTGSADAGKGTPAAEPSLARVAEDILSE